MKRRIFSLFLIFALLATLLPGTASAAEAWEDNVLKADFTTKTGGKVLGSDYRRDQISEIHFLDTLKNEPENCWDVSGSQNGSVKAWVKKDGSLYDLYIAAKGGVSAPESCSGMFYGYTKVEEIHFDGNFHTENAESMSYMFSHCYELEEVDLQDFDTANVTQMECMFMHCYELDELDLSGFDVSNVKDMGSMFWKCTDLLRLYLPELGYKNGRNTAYMFEKCDKNIVVTYGESPEPEEEPDAATAATTKPTTPNSAKVISKYPPALHEEFPDYSPREITDDYGDVCLRYGTFTSISSMEKVIEAYIDVLEDYGYTLVKSENHKDWRFSYWLDCSDTSLKTISKCNRSCHLYIEGFSISDDNNRISVFYSPSILDHYLRGGVDPNEPGPSPSPSPDPSPLPTIKTKCYKCHGHKTISCTNCDGKGYKEERISVPNYSGKTSGSRYKTVKQDCYKCVGGTITCPSCNGSGTN